MIVKKIEVEVSANTYEVLQVVTKAVSEIKKAANDGLQFSEVVALGTAFIGDLLPHIQQLNLIDDEAKENPVLFARTLAVVISDVAKALVS